MSGFAGVLALKGPAVDPAVLSAMREILARTAPHGGGSEGSLLYAHFESGRAVSMPASLDGRRWITGDLRLDARDELRAALEIDGDCDDARLVLHAFSKWGERCVDHLAGDFAFAIHDITANELFCARDPFGVKPFYYAHRGEVFVFSSALAAVRAHPAVAEALDDHAVADFLLFSIVLDVHRTIFADIRTLPAGHVMRVDANGASRRRWWTLPIEEPLRLDPRELVAAFNEHLARAVSDRITTPAIAVSMSGGLDSSSIATVASEVSSARMLAQTIVFDPLVPDDEERHAVAVARHLGIAHEIIRADRHRLFEQWDLPGFAKEEPANDPFSALTTSQFRRAAEFAPVMLAGQGGDAVFYASHPYFWNLLRRGRLIRFFSEIATFSWRRGRLPPLCLRSSFRRARGVRPTAPSLPAWIAPSLVAEFRLQERWDDYWNDQPDIHPTRPQAYNLLLGEGWQRLHEYTDPAAMKAKVEYRNPYLDVRLVRFLLRVPPIPWFAEKELLREAMRGRLPEQVRTRRKTVIGIDPAHIWMSRQDHELCALLLQSFDGLDRWIDRECACVAIRNENRTLYDSYLLSLPLSLGFWLAGRRG